MLYEAPYGSKKGWIPASGEGSILVVGEAGGREEEIAGVPLVGASGQALWQQLARRDIHRESFTVHNCLSCRPPDNKLLKTPWEHSSISHCSPNLDETIRVARQRANDAGKTFVIITLGVVAFKRVLGLDSKRDANLLRQDYYAYPFWSDKYQAWVYNCPHPAYLVRGKTELWPVVEFVFKRATEVADDGLDLETPDYLLDPPPSVLDNYIEGYKESLRLDPTNPLSYDIETPYKRKKSEDDVAEEDDQADHTILRVSFSFFYLGKTHTISIKWSAEYMAGIEALFAIAPFVLGWNSDKYDYPRVSRYVKIHGISIDGMVAWHILNTSLPKGLGFVTPYYWQTVQLWKHLSESSPAFYNAVDADAALRNYLGIKKHLIEYRLWDVFERHWIKLHEALKYMTGIGVKRDDEARDAAETRLTGILDELEVKMENAVPDEARKVKIAKKKPKSLEGWFETYQDFDTKLCSACRKHRPTASHFRSKTKRDCEVCGKSWTPKHIQPRKKSNRCEGANYRERETNPCVGANVRIEALSHQVWAKRLGFKLSHQGLSSYQQALRHQAILTRKEKKVTFDEDAIVLLSRKYPNDPLYPLIVSFRKAQKLLGTYVGTKLPSGRLSGGMEVGPDGRIHTSYGRNASTLRFTSENPNLQNLPRPNPKDPEALVNLIRNLIIAENGHILYARDFSGIEAVLSGYCAMDPGYIRLARRDVHTFYTVYALFELEGPKRLTQADLPQLSWSDGDLFGSLEALKSRFKAERNNLYKHLVHAANFMQGAAGAQAKIFSETGIEYPVRDVQRVMDIYYSLFPSIRRWHGNVLGEAEKDGYLRNPFGYVHRFHRVYDYKWERGIWVKRPGAEANQVVAFKPQSMAVAIITEALIRLYFNRFEEAGKWLRLQVHDELLFEIERSQWESVDRIVQEEMERPIPELKMPASWGMGDCLSILTEAKADLNSPSRWGTMKGIPNQI